MNAQSEKKPVTIDELAIMVAAGFANTATKEDVKDLGNRIDKLEQRIAKLEEEIKALSSKLTNYMQLTDKRYLELKHNNTVIAKWVKMIADKTGVAIDLAELDRF